MTYRISHGGAHLWIGYNGGTLTRREAEALVVDDPSLQPTHQRQLVHLFGSASLPSERWGRVGSVMCPLPNGRLLWRACAFLPTARAHVRSVFGSEACVDVPLEYAPLCWGHTVVGEDGHVALVVPRLGDGARAWVYKASGRLRIREVAMSRWLQ
jgi:hypothetical protein